MFTNLGILCTVTGYGDGIMLYKRHIEVQLIELLESQNCFL